MIFLTPPLPLAPLHSFRDSISSFFPLFSCLIVTLHLPLIGILSRSHRVFKFHYEMKCIQSGRQT